MHIGAWRSLVAHLLWEQGVVGSNPAAPIEISPLGAKQGLSAHSGGAARSKELMAR
jgi:hypothetical protein